MCRRLRRSIVAESRHGVGQGAHRAASFSVGRRSGRGRRRRGRGCGRTARRPSIACARRAGRAGRAATGRRRRSGTCRVSSSSSRRAPRRGRAAAASSSPASANRRRMWPPGTSRLSSSGVPSATSRPWSSTAIRSASWSASSRYCVVRKIVTPPATRSRTICHIVRRLRGSRPGGRLVEEDDARVADQASSPGRAGAACRRSRWPRACSAASARSNRSSSSAARRRPSRAAEVVQVGHQDQVLLAGEQVVDGRELAGDADRGADRVGVARRGRGRRRAACPASAPIRVDRIWTVVVLPAPFGPSSAKIVPSATSRSMPSSTTWSPKDLRRPVAVIADRCV